MNRILILTIFLTALLVSVVQADIYVWTDENGIKHFTNYSPPPEAKVVLETPEPPTNASPDPTLLMAEAARDLERINREIEEKQLIIALQQEEAEERIVEANRQAEAILQEAEALLEQAEETAAYDPDAATSRYGFGYGYNYGYRCRGYGYDKYGSCYPSYYRKDGGIYYYKERHHKPGHYRRNLRGHRKPDHFHRPDRNHLTDGRFNQRPHRGFQQVRSRNGHPSGGRKFGRTGGGGQRF